MLIDNIITCLFLSKITYSFDTIPIKRKKPKSLCILYRSSIADEP